MEDRLIEIIKVLELIITMNSLNPCFNGRQTDSQPGEFFKSDGVNVLILVLMEDRLIEKHTRVKQKKWLSLNPCFNGRQTDSYYIKILYFHYLKSLNPCFNGRQTDRMKFYQFSNY